MIIRLLVVDKTLIVLNGCWKFDKIIPQMYNMFLVKEYIMPYVMNYIPIKGDSKMFLLTLFRCHRKKNFSLHHLNSWSFLALIFTEYFFVTLFCVFSKAMFGGENVFSTLTCGGKVVWWKLVLVLRISLDLFPIVCV